MQQQQEEAVATKAASVWTLCVVSRFQALQSCLSTNDCDLVNQALYPSSDQQSATEATTAPEHQTDGGVASERSAHLERYGRLALVVRLLESA